MRMLRYFRCACSTGAIATMLVRVMSPFELETEQGLCKSGCQQEGGSQSRGGWVKEMLGLAISKWRHKNQSYKWITNVKSVSVEQQNADGTSFSKLSTKWSWTPPFTVSKRPRQTTDAWPKTQDSKVLPHPKHLVVCIWEVGPTLGSGRSK